MSEPWKDNEPAMKAMETALSQLRDHFENVQIFCSRINPDGTCDTQRLIMGKGNMYARVGQVRDWLDEAEKLVNLLEDCEPATEGTWRHDLARDIRRTFGMSSFEEEQRLRNLPRTWVDGKPVD